jgi:hypothetical protein
VGVDCGPNSLGDGLLVGACDEVERSRLLVGESQSHRPGHRNLSGELENVHRGDEQ